MSSRFSLAAVDYVHPDGILLFSRLSLDLEPGTCYGLVGENGAGKSTLLRLLAGQLAPARGQVIAQGVVAGLEPLQDLEGDIDHGLLKAAAALSLPADLLGQPVATLSGGEAMKLHLARAFAAEPDLLLLDEPSNHLDEEARAGLYRLIATRRGTTLIASHDRELLERVDAILAVRAGGIRLYGGAYSFYREHFDAEWGAMERQLGDAERDLAKAERQARLATERQERRSGKANRQQRERSDMPKILAGRRKRQAEATAGRLKGVHDDKVTEAETRRVASREALKGRGTISIDLSSTTVPARRRLVEAQDVNVRLGEAAEALWPQGVSFDIVGPTRWAVVGANGSGKTTLVRLLLGRLAPSSGHLRVHTARVAVLDQAASGLNLALSAFAQARELAPARTDSELRLLLGRFRLGADRADLPLASLSAGERMRAALACLLAADQAPELLILDEPTNDLDIPSVERLEEALTAYQGALVVISHDPVFRQRLGVTEQLVLQPRRHGRSIR